MNKKRLIDANELAKEYQFTEDHTSPLTPWTITDILNILDEAPTVDAVEVVHGRWNESDWGGVKVGGFMACSNCNVMIPKADKNHYCLLRLNYCPNCGAKMDGDGNG